MRAILTLGVVGWVVAALVVLAWAPGGQVAADPPTTSTTFNGDDLMVMNGPGNQRWELDADTGAAKHTNLNNGRTNSISIADFLEVWYDATDTSPSLTDQLITYQCVNDGAGTGVTTWLTGKNLVTRYVSYTDGLVISFEAPNDGFQSGDAAYVFQGQNFPRDWTGGHLQVVALEGASLSGTEPGHTYSLTSWSHSLNTSIGSISEGATTTSILAGTSAISGTHSDTNCTGTIPAVSPSNTTRWIVSATDICTGAPGTCP